MKYKNRCLSIAVSLVLCQGIFAYDLEKDTEEFDINSIVYIEDEVDFELGFDTADYLPEGFNPYIFYFDISDITYIEDSLLNQLDTEKHLPENFDAYTYPNSVKGINYIDPNDMVDLDIDIKRYLPVNFDAFSKNKTPVGALFLEKKWDYKLKH